MKHKPLTPKARWRRFIVGVIEAGLITGMLLGVMVACGLMCALAGYP